MFSRNLVKISVSVFLCIISIIKLSMVLHHPFARCFLVAKAVSLKT